MKSFKAIIAEASESNEMADSVRMLIQSIYELETEGLPEGADEGEVAEVGLDLISNYANRIPQDVLQDMMNDMAQYYDLDAEAGSEDDDDEDGSEDDDEEMSDEELGEALLEMQTAKQHKLLKIKAAKKAALGDKADTMNFKRNYYFDKITKKFVKRDKALSVATLKQKAKIFKKVLKKASTKLHAAKTKKKFDTA